MEISGTRKTTDPLFPVLDGTTILAGETDEILALLRECYDAAAVPHYRRQTHYEVNLRMTSLESLRVAKPLLRSMSVLYSQWKDCERCSISETRRKVCFGRGELPADVLFVGEQPGESEDIAGYPFVGAAGELLQGLVMAAYRDAFSLGDRLQGVSTPKKKGKSCLSFAFANVLGCWARELTEFGAGKKREPTKEEIKTCRPRLLKLLQLADPKLVVKVGKIAKTNLPERKIEETLGRRPKLVEIVHPAFILRMSEHKKIVAEKRIEGILAKEFRLL